MLKTIQLIRSIHPDTVIIVDDYDNYYIHDKDAYIVYYLTKLSIKKYKQNVFIKNNIDYINFLIDKLNKNYINNIVVVKRWGYDVDTESFYQNKFKFKKEYFKK